MWVGYKSLLGVHYSSLLSFIKHLLCWVLLFSRLKKKIQRDGDQNTIVLLLINRSRKYISAMQLQSGFLIFFFQNKIHPYQKCRHFPLTEAEPAFRKPCILGQNAGKKPRGRDLQTQVLPPPLPVCCVTSWGGERGPSMVLHAFLLQVGHILISSDGKLGGRTDSPLPSLSSPQGFAPGRQFARSCVICTGRKTKCPAPKAISCGKEPDTQSAKLKKKQCHSLQPRSEEEHQGRESF